MKDPKDAEYYLSQLPDDLMDKPIETMSAEEFVSFLGVFVQIVSDSPATDSKKALGLLVVESQLRSWLSANIGRLM